MKSLYESIKSSVGIGQVQVLRNWLREMLDLEDADYRLEENKGQYDLVLTNYRKYLNFRITEKVLETYPSILGKVLKEDGNKTNIVTLNIINWNNKKIDLSKINHCGESGIGQNAIIFTSVCNCEITDWPKHDAKNYVVSDSNGCGNIQINANSKNVRIEINYAIKLNGCRLGVVYLRKNMIENPSLLSWDGRNAYKYEAGTGWILLKYGQAVLDKLTSENKIDELFYAGGETDSGAVRNSIRAITKKKTKSGQEAWVIK